jgi:phosphoenolpyruvate carboxykinase (GTP)
VAQARDWTHGTFVGATLSSETTAAAAGEVGVVRRDPMAMLPFMGYDAGDYFAHWLNVGKTHDADRMPKVFYVNWFRRDEDGGFLWPGFGENSRVLEWVFRRCDGEAEAVETPIGLVPAEGEINLDGLDISAEAMAELTSVDEEGLRDELPQVEEHLAKFGDRLPGAVREQLEALKQRLG